MKQSKFEASKNSEGRIKKPSGSDAQYPPCLNPSCKSHGKPHPNCKCYGDSYAEGGEVSDEYYCDDNRMHRKACDYYAEGGSVKGVHKSQFNYPVDKADEGESEMGHQVKQGNYDKAKEMSKEKLAESKSQPKPKIQNFKDGGESDPIAQPELQSDADTDVDNSPPAEPDPTPMPTPPPQDIDKEIDTANQAAGPDDGSRDPAAVEPPDGSQDPSADKPESQDDTTAQFDQSPSEMYRKYKDDSMAAMANESENLKNDVNGGKITPLTYRQLMARDPLGKVSAMFGLMMSSIGSGLTHQPNAVLEMMNNEINNDLQAQQHSQENKQNLLKINQQGLMNQAHIDSLDKETEVKAYALTKVQMNNLALHKLTQDLTKFPEGSPQYQKAQQALGFLNHSVQNENFNIMDRAATASAYYKTLLGGGLGNGGGGANTTLLKSGMYGDEGKELGNDMEQKTIPGIPGRASRPVEQNDREKITAMKILSDKSQDVLNFAEKNKGTLSPAVRAQGAQKAAELVNFYNQSLGGALTGYKLPWLEGQIGKNPTSIFQDILGSNAKLREIKNSNDARLGTVLGSYGMSLKQGGGQGKPAAPQGGSTSRGGHAMVQKNGKWVYQ